MDQRVKVRIGNREVMDMKQGSWKRIWDDRVFGGKVVELRNRK